VSIKMLTLSPGEYDYKLENDSIYSAYLISGKLSINNQILKQKDFAIIEDADNVSLKVEEESQLFMIKSLAEPGYKTYAKRFLS